MTATPLRRAPGPCDPSQSVARLPEHDAALRVVLSTATIAFDRGASVEAVLDRVVCAWRGTGGPGPADRDLVRILTDVVRTFDEATP